MFATSTDPKAAAESVDGDIIANNAASLDGKLRTLVVGVADERGDELLAHRNRDPGVLFRHQRWVDAYKLPGQYITITDVDSGKQITKPISVCIDLLIIKNALTVIDRVINTIAICVSKSGRKEQEQESGKEEPHG